MISKVRFGYEGNFYDAFDITFKDAGKGQLVTRRAVEGRLETELTNTHGDFVSKTAQAIDEEIFYFLSDEELKKSLEDIECIVYCMYNDFDYLDDCQYKNSDGAIIQYTPYTCDDKQ